MKKYLRNSEDVTKDYRSDLIKYKVIKEEDNYSNEDILDLLDKKIHETEEYQEVNIATLDSFYHFCKYIIDKDYATEREVWNSFVKRMFNVVEHNQYSCTMAARGHGKSFFWAMYTLFKAYTNPFFECIIASNTPKMGKRLFRVLNRLIDSNEILSKKRNPDNKQDLPNSQDEMGYNYGFFEVTSIGTTPRSAHVNLAVADDPLRDDRRYSDEFVENYIFGQLFPIMGTKKGRLAISGTPQSHTDIFHITMKDDKNKLITHGVISNGEHKGFYCTAFPAILDETTKEVLLPEVWTYDDLMKVKSTQGELYFIREYQLICIDEKRALFPFSLIRRCTDQNILYLYHGEEDKNYIIGVDVATSGAASADFTSFVVLEIRASKKKENEAEYVSEKVIRHIYYSKGKEIREQVDDLFDLSIRFNNALVIVEKNNVGVALIQDLRRRNVNVEEFVTDKFKKESAIRFLMNEMQNGRLYFPEDTMEVKSLKEELRQYGVREVRGKEKMESLSGHDDLVDALWIANMGTQQFSSGLPFAVCQD